ncbi:potassium channel protein [Corallincola luteus]|uniref:Potassium channel protein n=1 Tax=Corallincola luteus TaxID=1775177 RepID=A0ABY2AI30_9GAMM|nr:potassium channel protein [Corallincola luteus]TCI02064.1 potassium channel protein [Corallincola luteus]
MQWWLRWASLRLNQHLRSLTWPALAGLVVGHAVTSYALLYLAGETALTENLSRYIYWFMVTISTVGYGDYSPESASGMWAVTLWVIPLGLGLFGSFIGKLATTISLMWEQTMKGERDFGHLSNHIVLIGWTPMQTLKIIELILGDKNRQQRQILLCVTDEMEHPCPDRIEVNFIRVESYSEPSSLQRAGIEEADKVIIDGDSDEETLAIALRVGALTQPDSTHVCAYFESESMAQLVETAYPHIEVSTSREAELLTRSMQDPGSSRVFEQLMNTLDGATQFSLTIPVNAPTASFGELFIYLKQQHDATLIAVADHSTQGEVEINPAMNKPLSSGVTLYYIAAQRLTESSVNWSALSPEKAS